jgi:hypothetical protein
MSTKCLLIDGNDPGNEDEFYEFPHALVVRWFENGRYGRIGTIGDGSCFFHSVCLATNYEDYETKTNSERKHIAHTLRRNLSDAFTEDNYNEIIETVVTTQKKSYQDIKRMLSEPATWAEEIMIKWASKQLSLNVVFLNVGDNVNMMYCGVHDKRVIESVKQCERPDIPTVIVAWVDHSHFELVARLDSVDDEYVTIRKQFDPKVKKDLKTIQNLMRAYSSKCKV